MFANILWNKLWMEDFIINLFLLVRANHIVPKMFQNVFEHFQTYHYQFLSYKKLRLFEILYSYNLDGYSINFFIDLEYINFGIEKALRTEKRASLLKQKNENVFRKNKKSLMMKQTVNHLKVELLILE
jgi:hypothetical protein